MNKNKEYRTLSVYGGSDINAQCSTLYQGVEIVVGTPGRVLDLLRQDKMSFEDIETFILDETDMMLNIGF